MAEKVLLDDEQTLRIANLKLQASCLAVLEIIWRTLIVTSMMESLSIQIAT